MALIIYREAYVLRKKLNNSVVQFTYGCACQDDGQPKGNTQKHLEMSVLFLSSLLQCFFQTQNRARICKRLRSIGIYFKESVPPA